MDFGETLVQVGGASANICSGDSGGPAVAVTDGREVQIGVMSFGDTQCAEVGVGTRVGVFVEDRGPDQRRGRPRARSD